MRKVLWLSVFCLWPAIVLADGNTSAYTHWDLEKTCTQVEDGDGYTYAGTWSCPGQGGIGMLVSVSDDRSYVGFGQVPAESCAYAKTFARFNTALSPVEWRLRNGKPFAAIQRWRVSTDDEGGSMTWLVVTALKGGEACPIHYVAGSYPEANAQARRAADGLVADFDCEGDVPTVDSRVGFEGIDLISCREIRDR
jgi:hypothetical protein